MYRYRISSFNKLISILMPFIVLLLRILFLLIIFYYRNPFLLLYILCSIFYLLWRFPLVDLIFHTSCLLSSVCLFPTIRQFPSIPMPYSPFSVTPQTTFPKMNCFLKIHIRCTSFTFE